MLMTMLVVGCHGGRSTPWWGAHSSGPARQPAETVRRASEAAASRAHQHSTWTVARTTSSVAPGKNGVTMQVVTSRRVLRRLMGWLAGNLFVGRRYATGPRAPRTGVQTATGSLS